MEPKVINLFDVDVDEGSQGPVFSLQSPDLESNFLHFDKGEGVPLHINAQVDVAGVVLEGEGFLQVDGQQQLLTEGDFFYIPKGTARKLRSAGGPFAYRAFPVAIGYLLMAVVFLIVGYRERRVAADRGNTLDDARFVPGAEADDDERGEAPDQPAL